MHVADNPVNDRAGEFDRWMPPVDGATAMASAAVPDQEGEKRDEFGSAQLLLAMIAGRVARRVFRRMTSAW